MVLAALANPQRLRIIAALTKNRAYVSELAREVGLSRPLVHMHLQRLEAAGLVTGSLELSVDGKAMKFFDVLPFSFHLTPALVSSAVATSTPDQQATGGRTS
ncbi:MAG: transcriptional regulator, ArsR family [Acidimicrobiia bacterium]|nr:transcriptional regulator, ArsR family [Acidimicrobiia bacterium]